MIGYINNFVLYSQTLSDEITTFTFEFDKPTGDVGGYYLHMSYDDITYDDVQFRIDYSHYKSDDTTSDYTYESESKVYFEYSTTSHITDGRLLYFRLRAISEYNEYSYFTDAIQIYTAPTKPSGLLAIYDGYEISLTWNELNTSTGINESFESFEIYRKRILALTGFELTDSTIYHDDLETGKSVYITDNIKRSKWFGEITTNGEFTLSTSNRITLASDVSNEYEILKDNLRLMIEDTSSTEYIGQSITNEYIDDTFLTDVRYIYSVTSKGTDDAESEETKYPIYTLDVESAYPYLRSPGNSDNEILQQTQWKELKKVLIDENYYDKTPFALPYFENELYNLKGYLGISNCKLDVFINNIYNHTTSTGDYGEFNLYYQFKKEKETLVSFQARDKFNIKFSRKSAPYRIKTVNMYSWFASMGEEYKESTDEIDYLIDDVNIENARYSSFTDMYAPLIEIYKIGDEDEDIFRTLSSSIFRAFEFATYDKSLEDVLDTFQDNLDSFDHYEIYYNENLYDTQRTSYTFTATSTGVIRGDYYYGVSSCNTEGAETDISLIRVDRRWWPPGYVNQNVIMWDYMKDANYYKVYKGSSENDLYLLTSTGYNFFIDINGLIQTSDVPRPYNYTDLTKPSNLVLYDKYGVADFFVRLRKPAALMIILYASAGNEIEDYNIERLLILFEKYIPPEIVYRVLYVTDDSVTLYPDDTDIDFIESLDYAIYDESYYDSGEVYS